MIHKSEIIVAIGAHGRWKEELAWAIAKGRFGLTVADVADHRACDFGKWLAALSPDDKLSTHYQQADALHRAFHVQAGRVLELALNGERAVAAKEMAAGGSYAQASEALNAALRAWMQAL
jgi:methyl-accepting chemotaxis protein